LTAYAEQEELEKLKAWWKEYGTALIVGVLLGVAVLIGVRFWTQHREESRQAASVLYDQLLQDWHAKQIDTARRSGESLLNDYSATPYAGMAALMLARMDFDAGDMTAARQHLQWVLDHGKDAATVNAARLRLARLLLNSGDKDAALALLNVPDAVGFVAEYEELKGDIFTAQGKRDQARLSYREALKHLPAGSAYAPILNMKLDDLGPEQAS
jgi:predicted negative regulator of RcsB-dependent stress response